MLHGPDAFLKTLAVVLGVAAGITVIFQRLRQPAVLGYLLAGVIIGPHVPVPLVADEGIVRTLSELGVILLMFSLGLGFRLRELVRVGPTAGLTAVIETSLLAWLGFLAGRGFGWTTLESLFAGAALAISSTTIVARVFEEQGVQGKLRELVIGVLVVEDLIAILFMTLLTVLAAGENVSLGILVSTGGRLLGFLILLVAAGLLVVPRTVRAVVRLGRPETTLVASIGICFALALLAGAAGCSLALGAFLAGSLVAESGEAEEVHRLVRPVRDMFAAIFFVSVGMLIDPALLALHWHEAAALVLLVVLGKVVGVSLGAFLTGHGTRLSVQAGLSLAQIGEFSFILAALGLSLGATRSFLYPVAVAVSAATSLLAPGLIRASGRIANWVDRKLPKPLQTLASLYGTWMEGIRAASRRQPAQGSAVRRLVGLLFLDAALLASLAVGSLLFLDRMASALVGWTGLAPAMARLLLLCGAPLLGIPFCVGIIGLARKLGALLAAMALPPSAVPGTLDLAAAPRRTLVVTLQLGILVLVGAPLLAVTQPFLPGLPVAAILLVLLAFLGVLFWRSAANLQGHVQAGAGMIVEALGAQMRQAGARKEGLEQIHRMLPGIGDPVPVRLPASSPADGRNLAELNLRGQTGATVLVILRGDTALTPTAREGLRAGDVLVLAGTREAIAAATAVLAGSAPQP